MANSLQNSIDFILNEDINPSEHILSISKCKFSCNIYYKMICIHNIDGMGNPSTRVWSISDLIYAIFILSSNRVQRNRYPSFDRKFKAFPPAQWSSEETQSRPHDGSNPRKTDINIHVKSQGDGIACRIFLRQAQRSPLDHTCFAARNPCAGNIRENKFLVFRMINVIPVYLLLKCRVLRLHYLLELPNWSSDQFSKMYTVNLSYKMIEGRFIKR